MTRYECISKLPYKIIHPTWGESFLEVVCDNSNEKRVCYWDAEGVSASYGTSGATWKQLFDDLNQFLKDEGHI